MSIQTVTAEILAGNFTNDQLSSIIDSVKYARSKLTRHTIRSLQVGDNVNFNSAKQGRNVTGVVTKIAIKYVTVRSVSGLWRVPANMLTVIEDETEFA
jgi:small-conductance mechanosensitive channel